MSGRRRLPTVEQLAEELWNADHDDGKAVHGITLITYSADRRDHDNREAWIGYLDNAKRVLRLLRRRR